LRAGVRYNHTLKSA